MLVVRGLIFGGLIFGGGLYSGYYGILVERLTAYSKSKNDNHK